VTLSFGEKDTIIDSEDLGTVKRRSHLGMNNPLFLSFSVPVKLNRLSCCCGQHSPPGTDLLSAPPPPPLPIAKFSLPHITSICDLQTQLKQSAVKAENKIMGKDDRANAKGGT
jgi:hypothetical protein